MIEIIVALARITLFDVLQLVGEDMHALQLFQLSISQALVDALDPLPRISAAPILMHLVPINALE